MNKNAFEMTGLKKTKNREKILSALEKIDFPITAEELFYSFKQKDINLSTVYRTLNSFVEAGLVKREINANKENVFSLLKDKDEHVLVCTSCHKKVVLNFCPYHEANELIQSKTGFVLQDQNTEIYGLCPDCQKHHER